VDQWMVFKKKEKIAPSVITCPARTAFIGVSSSSSFFLFFFFNFFFHSLQENED
jgi:hypothetical protein